MASLYVAMALQNHCNSCMLRENFNKAMQWPHDVNSVFLINYYNGSAMPLGSHCNGFAKPSQWPHKNEAIARAATAALHTAPGYG